ncbi:MAG TPA: hypothetical protein VG013_00195 [Gemmataceae bacterium]|jgi:hypothetical protein|nr:hypothetical protein [Gemmataceae bacterium]
MAKMRRQSKRWMKGTTGGSASPAANGAAENTSGYFRAIFKERPDLLRGTSNAELLERWHKDHPGEKEVPERIKQILSNVKSVLRRKGRKKRAAKQAGQPVEAVAVAPATAGRKLDKLEEYIDECLTMAKNLDRQGLEGVIKLLRRARNEVVWKIGQ